MNLKDKIKNLVFMKDITKENHKPEFHFIFKVYQLLSLYFQTKIGLKVEESQ